MPEHVHLLLRPHDGVAISGILSAIKQPVAKRAVLWAKREAPAVLEVMADRQPNGECSYRFWQRGGGYDRNLWTPADIHEKINYIHRNPLRRGFVERVEDWRWSSWHTWECGKNDLLPIDRETIPALA